MSRLALAASAILLIAFSIFYWTASPEPTLTAVDQLTSDGVPKIGPLLSDGANLYFQERFAGKPVAASVVMGGGQVTRFVLPAIDNPALLDFLPFENAFLLCAEAPGAKPALWKWVPGAAPAPLNLDCPGAWISPSTLVQAHDGSLRVVDLANPASPRAISTPGRAEDPRWLKSRQLLRFTLASRENQSAIWELHGLEGKPAPLGRLPPNASHGRWTPSGGVFAFQAARSTPESGDDLWVIQESSLPRAFSKPRRLTHPPLDFSDPLPLVNGRAIFAIGRIRRMELLRFDSTRGQFVPFLRGIQASEAEYSPDAEWIVYAAHPGRTLWKIRPDGKENTQLTVAPMLASSPHWSPDGSTIAFTAQLPGKPSRIFTVPASGGTPVEAAKAPGDEGAPTWSADGKSLVFDDAHQAEPSPATSIHRLDLATGIVSSVPNSTGLFAPRYSPDGKKVLAVTADHRRLVMLDPAAGTWEDLLSAGYIDHPAWAADSAFIYFTNESSLNRINVYSKRIDRVVDLSAMDQPRFAWHGLAPDGTPLAAQMRSTEEIYRLMVRW